MKICRTQCPSERRNSHHRGKESSFWMHDPELIFNELDLKKGEVFLDFGCGTGDYSIHAAEKIGETGLVYAIDIKKELIDNLVQRTEKAGLENLIAIVSDAREQLPFEDKSIDLCLISTVLHTMNLEDAGKTIFTEIGRVLKPGGRLIIIECKKEDSKFGPPLSMRISPDEMEEYVYASDFEKSNIVDLGYNYMIKFVSMKDNSGVHG
ncbi:class I SAM-dependent methyltransferase [Methanolobus vulcani]|uniref:Methyltransferase domain-containing protein n=1 Tax=Methanolobus vulcani TaxID=38026 RepID=A0A7Z8P3B4_9EURY|nr:methyltransferase domain-containing protein [Methanolobus vulcani]TQD27651.1 methyltransferase domain-containing protein [Methanolobus vulcani]